MQEGHTAAVDLVEEIEISSVPVELVSHVWNTQIEQLKKLQAHGQGDTLSLDDTLQGIKDGKLLMWAIHRGTDDILGFVVFSLEATQTSTKVWVRALVGVHMELWSIQLRDLAREFMDLVGIEYVEASCRPGMAHLLKKVGWTEKAVIMELR